MSQELNRDTVVSFSRSKLDGKIAFVTGASRGIGAAIAIRLAREGADVAFTYARSVDDARAVATEIEATGHQQALPLQADSDDPAALSAAVKRAVEELGGLDILVNNAGILIFRPIPELTVEDFDRIVAVNVRAVFVAVQAAAQHLKKGGRIITIGSCNAERVPMQNAGLYAMSKSALVGLTKGFARDLGPQGITVNLVQPGPIATDMNPPDGPQAEIKRNWLAIPEYGSADDVAAMVAYLAGPEAHFVTGTALTIDGGYTV